MSHVRAEKSRAMTERLVSVLIPILNEERSLPELGSAEILPNPSPEGPAEVLSVNLMKVPAAQLNRTLVEGGCEVSELRSEKRDLLRAFEELVAHAGTPGAAK